MIPGADARLVLAMLVLTSGCDPLTPEERAFVELGPDEQIREIMSSEPDERIDLYLLAYGRVAPSNTAAKQILAELGVEILPDVLDRLRREANGMNTSHLIDLLVAMEIQKSYCVSCDEDAMKVVDDAVQRIRNDALRSDCLDRVNYFLRGNQGA